MPSRLRRGQAEVQTCCTKPTLWLAAGTVGRRRECQPNIDGEQPPPEHDAHPCRLDQRHARLPGLQRPATRSRDGRRIPRSSDYAATGQTTELPASFRMRNPRARRRSFKRASMTRPAAIATRSGSKADSPRAMTSALTNSSTASAPRSSAGATVDLPAPFGPARITTLGRGRVIVFRIVDALPCRRISCDAVRYNRRSASLEFLRRRGTEVVVTGAPRKRLVG